MSRDGRQLLLAVRLVHSASQRRLDRMRGDYGRLFPLPCGGEESPGVAPGLAKGSVAVYTGTSRKARKARTRFSTCFRTTGSSPSGVQRVSVYATRARSINSSQLSVSMSSVQSAHAYHLNVSSSPTRYSCNFSVLPQKSQQEGVRSMCPSFTSQLCWGVSIWKSGSNGACHL